MKNKIQVIHITKSDDPTVDGNKWRETMCGLTVKKSLVIKTPISLPQGHRGCRRCYITYRRLPFRMFGR